MRKIFNTFVTLVLAVSLSAPVNAADELLPVTEAFKYVVSDTGEAFEIDWAIYKHAYLYKSRLSFESGSDAIVLGFDSLHGQW
jgi:thiol:disulfide interchange protein